MKEATPIAGRMRRRRRSRRCDARNASSSARHRSAAQRGARAAHARHHGADRRAHDLGRLGVAELLDAHQQQCLALLGRQAGQRAQQVQAQADVGAGVAAVGVLRALHLVGVDHRQAGVAPATIEVRVVRDRQQPHRHVARAVELLPARQCPLQRQLRQVVGHRAVQPQRTRIAAQARDRVEQVAPEGGWGVHGGLTSRARALFRPPGRPGGSAPGLRPATQPMVLRRRFGPGRQAVEPAGRGRPIIGARSGRRRPRPAGGRRHATRRCRRDAGGPGQGDGVHGDSGDDRVYSDVDTLETCDVADNNPYRSARLHLCSG